MDQERFPDHEDPEVLCRRARRGDRDSFNRLVRLFQPKVFKLVLSILRHREDALDAVQETFMKVYSGLDSYQEGKGFEAWLMRIAKNVAIDHYRYQHSKRRWSWEKESLSLVESSLASPANDHAQKEMRHLVEKALSRLADKQRLVFLLRYLQGYSFEEIAAIMGLATGTVKSLHFKALEKMKLFIKESLETGGQP